MEWFEGTKQQWYLFRNGINKNFDTKKTNINIVYSYIHVVHSTHSVLAQRCCIQSISILTSQQENSKKDREPSTIGPRQQPHKLSHRTESVRIHTY